MTMSSASTPAARPGRRQGRRISLAGLTAVGASVAMAALAAGPGYAAAAPTHRFTVTNLVSDVPGVAPTTDPNLVNPWGTSELPDGPLWVSDQGTGVSTLYTGDVGGSALTPVPLVVTIPGGGPTGQVFNGNFMTAPGDFTVSNGTQSGPAVFIFATLAGQISGWNPGVGSPAAGVNSTNAQVAATVTGASYTGLAIDGATLYAADFGRGTVDVFNSAFQPVVTPGAFTDRALPAGFRPFNAEAVNGNIVVTYARPDPKTGKAGNVIGAGFVDVFSPQGALLRRLIRRGVLDSPWGLVIAPSGFGAFSGALLVGNFGDGFINAFDPASGRFLGALRDARGRLIHEDRLWSLILGDGAAATPQTLLFTAGIGNEQHGLIGSIVPAG
ncbi:MAG TPA: TIGR03118 family protein [Streptosporangiaceae bacterium]|nr:TIGR03118 family protein [Streptosporangiaceae bacterium]